MATNLVHIMWNFEYILGSRHPCAYLVFIVGANYLTGSASIVAGVDKDILFILFTATTWTVSSICHFLRCHPFLVSDTVRRVHVAVKGRFFTWARICKEQSLSGKMNEIGN